MAAEAAAAAARVVRAAAGAERPAAGAAPRAAAGDTRPAGGGRGALVVYLEIWYEIFLIQLLQNKTFTRGY